MKNLYKVTLRFGKNGNDKNVFIVCNNLGEITSKVLEYMSKNGWEFPNEFFIYKVEIYADENYYSPTETLIL